MNKQLYKIAREHFEGQAEKVRAECRGCRGTGKSNGIDMAYGATPCPTCTPEYDRLMEKAREAKWKFDECSECELEEDETCAGCNSDLTANPSLIRDMLVDMGELEAFMDWHIEQIYENDTRGMYGFIHFAEYEILLDGKLLAQAVISWKGEKG